MKNKGNWKKYVRHHLDYTDTANFSLVVENRKAFYLVEWWDGKRISKRFADYAKARDCYEKAIEKANA